MARKQAAYNLHHYVQDANLNFEQSAFNEVDGLVMAEAAYLDYSAAGIDLYSGESKTFREIYSEVQVTDSPAQKAYQQMSSDEQQLLKELAESKRYQDLSLSNFTNNPSKNGVAGFDSIGGDQYMEQFAAVTISYTQDNQCYNYVSYRGTDGTSDGWAEDFAMIYSPGLQAQEDAKIYLNVIGKQTEGAIVGGGHSKGGGCFEYAYLFCDDRVRERIVHGYVYDSPGVNEDILAATSYYGQYEKITNQGFYCPQDSVIGQVLHESDNAVFVHSVESGLLEHDPYSWEINPDTNGFVLDEQTELSKYINRALDDSVSRMSAEQREAFFDFIGYLLYNSDGEGLDGLGNLFTSDWKEPDGSFNWGKLESVCGVLVGDWRSMKPDEQDAFVESLGKLVSGFAATAYDKVKQDVNQWAENTLVQINQRIEAVKGTITDWVNEKKNQFCDFLNKSYKSICEGVDYAKKLITGAGLSAYDWLKSVTDALFNANITRDFSDTSKQRLLGMVDQVESEKWSDFTDWIGDRWYDFETWIGALNIKTYINDVNSYHKMVIDKNNTTKNKIEEIFQTVHGVDSSYGTTFHDLGTNLSELLRFVQNLSEIVEPGKGRFTDQYISYSLKPVLTGISRATIQSLRDSFLQDINGEVVFDEELIYEYLKKPPEEITDAEKALLLEVISEMQDEAIRYETWISIGNDNLGLDMGVHTRWDGEDRQYERYHAISEHYKSQYLNVLNFVREHSEDENTFAASLMTFGVGESVLTLMGVEKSENVKDIFGSDKLDAYLAKFETEHGTVTLLEGELSEKDSLKSNFKADKLNDKAKDKLKDDGLYDEFRENGYYKDGKEIDEKDAPEFYKRQQTILEYKHTDSAEVSLFQGDFDTLLGGDLSVTVGRAEAHDSISGGLYITGKNDERIFNPGGSIEIGASATALKLEYENQVLGDEMLGVNLDGTVTVGEVSAKASGEVNFLGKDKDGNIVFDPQVNAGIKAEAILAKAEGSAGVNILGGEVGVKGSVQVGIGANANIGLKDGVFKCEIGASLGIGFNLGLEVDVGGMVNTVADAASSAWDYVSSGWSKLFGG